MKPRKGKKSTRESTRARARQDAYCHAHGRRGRTRYDYIIAGAGSAGCVLANRLSADPGVTVLLIEAGGPDRHPMLHIPKGSGTLMENEKYVWRNETTPFGPNQRPEHWTRGKVLGGSSSINGMVYNRGNTADYDELERLGNTGWGWDVILPIFKSFEDNEFGPSATRGAGGPLHISVAHDVDPVCNEDDRGGKEFRARCDAGHQRVGRPARRVLTGDHRQGAPGQRRGRLSQAGPAAAQSDVRTTPRCAGSSSRRAARSESKSREGRRDGATAGDPRGRRRTRQPGQPEGAAAVRDRPARGTRARRRPGVGGAGPGGPASARTSLRRHQSTG